MDWNNIDLKSAYERDQNILDSYSFDVLLLEVHCNIKKIDKNAIRKQFNESLDSKINSAREVFEANLSNIVKDAQEHKNKP